MLSKGLFYIVLFVPFPSYMRHENVSLVSVSPVRAAVIELANSEEDAFVSCLVIFSVQADKKRRSETIATCSYM